MQQVYATAFSNTCGVGFKAHKAHSKWMGIIFATSNSNKKINVLWNC